jgi:transposase
MATGSKKRVRRSFTEEFKAGAVRLVLDEGKTVSQVGRDLDVSQSVVGNWVKQARADRSNGKTGLTTEERSELVKLRREVRELRLQRDLLKKAALFARRASEVRAHRRGEGEYPSSSGMQDPRRFAGGVLRSKALS